MAYVGTPTRLADPRTTLASIIQGEAGGEGLRGMQAVAQVISNRASQNFSGYGTSLVDQATARNQFQGQSLSRISPEAYTAADQALNGSLPNVVGSGAVNYANPGASTASWARNLNSDNSLQLGNHFFTDNTRGRAYSPDLSPNGYQDPNYIPGQMPDNETSQTLRGMLGSGVTRDQYNAGTLIPAGDGLGYGSGGQTVETSAGSQITGFQQNADGSANVELGFGDGSPSSTTGIDGASFGTGNFAGGVGAASVTDGLPSSLSGSGPSLAGATLDPGVSASSVTDGVGSGDNIAGYNAAGPVQANPALVGATNAVASATTKGDDAINKGVQKAGQTVGQAITSSTSSVLTWASDSLLRVFVLIIGIALFAGALYYFAKPQIDSAVQGAVNTAGKVARAVPVPV